jgi:hypothetical protein
MNKHTLITAEDIAVALAELTPCPDCASSLGICVEPDGDWDAVVAHSGPCPAVAQRVRDGDSQGRPSRTA